MKLLVITGTSRGLGKALAEHYLDSGWKVIGLSRGSSPISDNRYIHHQVDLSDSSQIESFINRIRQLREPIYGLINNAGISSMNHILTTPIETISAISQINYLAAFQLIQGLSKLMTPNKEGRIVNLSSVAAPLSLAGEAAYSASKAALESLSKTAAKELGPYGITVNVVGPTPMDTDLIKGVPKEKIDALLSVQSIKAKASLQDLIHVVDFFLSNRARLITGQTLYLGGIA